MLRPKVIAHLGGDLELAGELICIPGSGMGKAGHAAKKRSNSETTS